MAERSPNYPAFNLEYSIGLLEKLYSKCGRTQVTREIAAKALGYASLNGSANKAIAALVAYGLATRSKDKIATSDIGLTIIRPVKPEARNSALQLCALTPKAFSTIHEKYPESEEEILSMQLLHDSFSEDGAKKAARIYKENESYAGISTIQSNADELEGIDEEVASKSPSEESLIDKPPAMTPKSHGMNLSNQAINPSSFVPIPLDIGDALIPKGMSEDDFSFLLDALKLYKRKIIAKATDQGVRQEEASVHRWTQEAVPTDPGING